MKIYLKAIFAVTYLLFFLVTPAQDSYRAWFKYLSPKPEAKFIMPEQKISFRLQNPATAEVLIHTKINLEGSVSGYIGGLVSLTSDKKTVIFCPSKRFALNEVIELTIQFPESLNIPDFSTSFTTTALPAEQRKMILHEIRQLEVGFDPALPEKLPMIDTSLTVLNDSLPEGFPAITITHWNDPSEGYVFISPHTYENDVFFMIILDNYATPVFYQQLPQNGGTDFKLQPNGLLTIFLYSENKFLVYNSAFEAKDTIGTGNGYTADLHEFRYYTDEHAFLMAFDPQLVDMSLIVPGGQEDAVVTGLIVQELDENQEVVFQWRSWDHFQITDASDWIDLTASSIDYVHGNSIEVVSEDELMICSRNMNEVTKIDRNTGDIIWRLNGKNNMFDFVEPADSFCVQHAIRLMPDSNNISLFDNGGCWNPQYSSAVEYILDEENFTCTLVERLQSDPDIFGPFMGNTQRLLNGHTINGWGKGIPSVTEFDPDGNILLQLSFPYLNYRAFKFDWQHTVFSADAEEVDFGSIHYLDSAFATLTLTNNFTADIIINRVLNHKDVYSVTNDLPVQLPQGGTTEVQIKFKPGNSETFNDVLTLCWDIHSDTLNQRIAVQVKLTGSASGNEGVEDLQAAGFTVYPSPFNDFIVIESEKEAMEGLMFFDMEGKEVFRKENIGSGLLNQQLRLTSGVYLLRIKTVDGKYYSGKVIRE